MRTSALLLVVCLTAACKQDVGPESVSDQSDIPVRQEGEPPMSIEHCYAGVAHYGISEADLVAASQCTPGTENCLGPQTMLLRRSSRPEASIIIEQWIAGATTSTFPIATEHTLRITESRFNLDATEQVNPRGAEQKQLAWTGAGELEGEPWQWTKWTSRQHRNPPVLDVVTAQIDGDVLRHEIAFTLENGSIVLLRRGELREFPCAEWDARTEAALTAPAPGTAPAAG
jgi:hypothetical protein